MHVFSVEEKIIAFTEDNSDEEAEIYCSDFFFIKFFVESQKIIVEIEIQFYFQSGGTQLESTFTVLFERIEFVIFYVGVHYNIYF